MHSISSFDAQPLSWVIVIQLNLPVVLSAADTFKMPFTLMSKVTLTWGTPQGAGVKVQISGANCCPMYVPAGKPSQYYNI